MNVQQVRVQNPSSPGGPVVAVQVPAGTPQTRQELDQLHFRRQQLKDQVGELIGRREGLRAELNRTDVSGREELQARVKELDARILRINDEVDRTSELIANAPPHLFTSQTQVDPAQIAERITNDLVPLAGIFSVFVLLPFAIAVSRLIWRRASALPRSAAPDPGTQRQLEQMSQAIDAIAIEVERISEGQRFVAKMLSDREHAALGPGAANPISSSKKASVPSELG